MEAISEGYIKFVPVCSKCGGRIYDTVACDEISQHLTPGIFCKKYQITPSICPHCKTQFQSIVIPTQLPFDGYEEISWFE